MPITDEALSGNKAMGPGRRMNPVRKSVCGLVVVQEISEQGTMIFFAVVSFSPPLLRQLVVSTHGKLSIYVVCTKYKRTRICYILYREKKDILKDVVGIVWEGGGGGRGSGGPTKT
jgi:hypothetical protein